MEIHKNKYSVPYKQPVTSKFHVKNRNNIIIKKNPVLKYIVIKAKGASWMDEERGRGGSGPEVGV